MSREPKPTRVSPSRYVRQRARLVRRRRLMLGAVVLAGLGGGALGVDYGLSAKNPSQTIAMTIGGGTVGHATVRDSDGHRLTRSAVAQSLPARVRIRKRGLSILRVIDRSRAAARMVTAKSSTVRVPSRVVGVSIAAPVIAQRLRNNCEMAALSVLLATRGIRVDQLELQRRLARSGPADPQGSEDAPVWGDPDVGYVGRVDGTGPWGGFGVYPGPVARLAAEHGRRLDELTGAPPSSLYRTVLAGRAVMAWVGLDDGPYRDWTTTAGRPVQVNLNEHTIVLTGVRPDGSLEVVNVLKGTREVWTSSRFEQAWSLLGKRALATT